MTDSIDRKYKGGATKEQIAALAKLPEIKTADRTEPHHLPTWAKLALIKHELFGMSWKDAAEEFGKTASTLKKYGLSPIGQSIRKEVREFRDDPIEVAKALLASNAVSVTLDRMTFLEWAKKAGDYAAGDRIAADLQDRMGITKKNQKAEIGGMTIHLTLPSGSAMEPIMVQTEHKEVDEIEEAEWEMS
jgi:hypothetical protein